MKNMKFATKLLLVVLSISLVAMIAVAVIAYNELLKLSSYSQDVNTQLGFLASTQSQDALISQAESYLSRLSTSQAEGCDQSLIMIEDDVVKLAGYMTRIYEKPENFQGLVLPRPDETEMGVASGKMMTAKSAVPGEALEAEKKLSSNADFMFASVFDANDMLSNAYFGTESGISYRYSRSNAFNPDFDPRERPWYQGAMEAEGPIWLGTYVDSYGAIGTTCAMAYKNAQGEKVGVVAADISLLTMVEDILKVRIGETGYAFLLDGQGNYLAHPNYDQLDMVALTAQADDYKEVLGDMAKGLSGVKAANIDDVNRYVAYAPLDTTGWSLGIIVDKDEVIRDALKMKEAIDGEALAVKDQIRDMLNSVLVSFLILLCVSIVAVMCLSFLMASSVTRPIRTLTRGVELVGQGNLDQKIAIDSNDEIGKLAKTFNAMTDNLKSHINHLHKVTAEKQRITTELEVAHKIQSTLLPCTFPAYPDRSEFDIYASMEPAKEVGGDFYDFFLVGEKTLAVVIADVSGKGVAAALFMVIARTMIKNSVQTGLSPAQVFEQVNNLLCENNEAGMFVTALMGYLDIDSGHFRYVNAGHNPPLIRRAHGSFAMLPVKPGFVLAGMEGIRYREMETTLGSGDELFLYTDGVTEAVNPREELFGDRRLLDAANACPRGDVTGMLPRIRKAIDAFADGAEQADDITMLAVVKR